MIIKFVRYIDGTVLSGHQGISNWMQENVGYANFSLARACLWILIGISTFDVYVYMSLTDNSAYIGFKESIAAAIVFIVLCVAGFFLCRKIEKECRRDVAKNRMNRREKTLRGIRLLLLGIAINHISFFSIAVWMVIEASAHQIVIGKSTAICVCLSGITIGFVITSFFYFISCTPLRPFKSKLQLWLDIKKKGPVFA